MFLCGDRQLLLAAAGNLLQNAFKFTQPGTEVTLHAHASGDRILIDVEDGCGGLPAGDAERLFVAFEQRGDDRSGVGLGLSIARRSVEANRGTLTARDMPGRGCVFTIDLPNADSTTARATATTASAS
jgi:signal transduction histidine kinase